jgi:uncharacterized protein YbbC (DUF1343 family)
VKRGEDYWIDRLLGSERPRLALEAGVPVESILEEVRASVQSFRREREKYLLY